MDVSGELSLRQSAIEAAIKEALAAQGLEAVGAVKFGEQAVTRTGEAPAPRTRRRKGENAAESAPKPAVTREIVAKVEVRKGTVPPVPAEGSHPVHSMMVQEIEKLLWEEAKFGPDERDIVDTMRRLLGELRYLRTQPAPAIYGNTFTGGSIGVSDPARERDLLRNGLRDLLWYHGAIKQVDGLSSAELLDRLKNWMEKHSNATHPPLESEVDRVVFDMVRRVKDETRNAKIPTYEEIHAQTLREMGPRERAEYEGNAICDQCQYAGPRTDEWREMLDFDGALFCPKCVKEDLERREEAERERAQGMTGDAGYDPLGSEAPAPPRVFTEAPGPDTTARLKRDYSKMLSKDGDEGEETPGKDEGDDEASHG